MGIIRNVLNQQIAESSRQQCSPITGEILGYDKVSNTASVRYYFPGVDGYIYRQNVPVADNLNGTFTGGLIESQKVSLMFINNNPYSPVITGVVGTVYDSTAHPDQGTYLIDEGIREDVEPLDDIIPMSQDWIDQKNEQTAKYTGEMGNYSAYDSVEEHYEMVYEMERYADGECGMTNLDTKSAYKLKDNGDIDIFVEDNTGIRVSALRHCLYFYGFDFFFNGNKLKIGGDSAWEEYVRRLLINAITELLRQLKFETKELNWCFEFTDVLLNDIMVFAETIALLERYQIDVDAYSLEDVWEIDLEELFEWYDTFYKYYETFTDELFDAKNILEV